MMSEPSDAVRTLEQRGIIVRVFPGPPGSNDWFYRIKSHGGVEYQIGNAELLLLMEEDKLHWADIKAFVEKSRK